MGPHAIAATRADLPEALDRRSRFHADAILNAVNPDEGHGQAGERLEEVRALVVQLNDVFAGSAD
jgi:hypothetical protein